MNILAVINQKGGVGKTSTAISIAAWLVTKKKKVLLIDFDGSGNLTLACNGESDGVCTAYDMMCRTCSAEDAIQNLPSGFDLIAANSNLPGAEGMIADQVSRIVRLKQCIEPIKNKYDWIIIDTPPNLGFLTVNALVAATDVLIPSEPDILSAKGILNLVDETIRSIKDSINPNLRILGIVFTRYSGNTKNSKAMSATIKQMADQYGVKVFDTCIRNNVDVKNSQSARMTIVEYKKNANAAQDYLALTNEIIKEAKKHG